MALKVKQTHVDAIGDLFVVWDEMSLIRLDQSFDLSKRQSLGFLLVPFVCFGSNVSDRSDSTVRVL